MRAVDKIEVKQNLTIVVRERGKIVTRREGHNIWVNLGREYLASLIAYSSFAPVTAERNDRVRYMGLGIGGTRQLLLSVANNPPMSTTYPGTNLQTDEDPTLTTLERPVRVDGSGGGPPYSGTDTWLAQVQAPSPHGTPTEVTFRRLFGQLEFSYGSFTNVPLSEIGLYTGNATPVGVPNNTFIAYDTFDAIPKTNAFSFEVNWTIRF